MNHRLITRAEALLFASVGSALAACCRKSAVRVGSKNFIENVLLAEVYAATLERAGVHVERHMVWTSNFDVGSGGTEGIDLFPEYTGTGLTEVLHLGPPWNAKEQIPSLKRFYSERGFDWLNPSPAEDSQALAVPNRSSISTLTECSSAANHLVLAGPADFFTRRDGLLGLRKTYGGFQFKATRPMEIGRQYETFRDHEADVIVSFTTDPQILETGVRLLADDRHFWPQYNVAPVIRSNVLRAYPSISRILNALAPLITTKRLQNMNFAVYEYESDPAEVAAEFLHDPRVFDSRTESWLTARKPDSSGSVDRATSAEADATAFQTADDKAKGA